MPHTSTALPLKPEELAALLRATFAGSLVEVRDDTHLHAAHNAAMQHSGGHYRITITWAGFAGLSRAAAHRAVHQALRGPLEAGRIHALTIRALTPEQAP